MSPIDKTKFRDKKISCLVSDDQVPMAGFVEDDGRRVFLPYNLLGECVLTADGKVILADFRDLSAVIHGDNLGEIWADLGAHKLAMIQAGENVSSVVVGPSEESEKKTGVSDSPSE
jgi:hypothetical protein